MKEQEEKFWPDSVIELASIWLQIRPKEEEILGNGKLAVLYAFIRKIGYENVLTAVTAACDKDSIESFDPRFRYVCGTCHTIGGTRRRSPDESKPKPKEKVGFKELQVTNGKFWTPVFCPVCGCSDTEILGISSEKTEIGTKVSFHGICANWHSVRMTIKQQEGGSAECEIHRLKDLLT